MVSARHHGFRKAPRFPQGTTRSRRSISDAHRTPFRQAHNHRLITATAREKSAPELPNEEVTAASVSVSRGDPTDPM